ncbi:hypothetical protein EC957_003475 [Mortierella hygrophila]|uniref:Uncharacterized protein n=1 Tax=Mortierella hygrophila TaxID=979708 RepID=A0A9P6FGB4_9FUNG|nr:hypothetical protein EC957_003475 [Mortierella hygrophila]
MKLPVPKIAILALATCVGSIQQAEANKAQQQQQPMDVNRAEKPAEFEAGNNDRHGHHHHGHHDQREHHHHNKHHHHREHHHKKPHPKPEPEFCEQIDLVCDHIIIDTITCPTEPILLLAESGGADTPGFEATNNGGSKRKCTVISQRYVQMPFPCHKTPEKCGSGLSLGDSIAVQGETDAAYPEVDDAVDNTEETDVTDELVGGAADDDDEDDMAENDDRIIAGGDAAQSPLQKRTNSHKYHRHHRKPHHNKVIHHKHHHKGGKYGHKHDKDGDNGKKKGHSWAGLCTSSGNVCGYELFGCDFKLNAVYICTHPGAVPKMDGGCSGGCKKGECTEGRDPDVTNPDALIITTTTSTAETTPTTTKTPDEETEERIKITTTTTPAATTATTTETTTTSDEATTTEVSPTTTTTTTAAVEEEEKIKILTTTTTTTTPAAITEDVAAITTEGSLCETIVNTFKGVLNTAFDTITGFIPMIPESLRSLISPVIDTLTGLKGVVDNALKDVGTFASTAASALAQLVAIANVFKQPTADLVPGIDGLIDTALNVFGTVAKAGQDVATCMGAPKNCSGLLVILGYVLKAALPLIQDRVAGMGTIVPALLGGVLKTLEGTIDKLISGASDAVSSLKSLVDTVNMFASFLPSEIKLPLDIIKAVLDAADNCNKGL